MWTYPVTKEPDIEFYKFGDVKPRKGRNVILRFSGKLYLAQFNGHDWHLLLADENIRASEDDEWTGIL